MAGRSAVLAGATGLVGSRCLDLLLQSDHYAGVTALVRRPLAVQDSKLAARIVDFDALPELGGGAPDVFCALGTTIRKAGSQEEFRRIDYGFTWKLAERAIAAGARQFVLVSSVGASAQSSTFYLRVKGELEEAISSLPFQAVHILRPSFLTGNRQEHRGGENLAIAAAKVAGFALIGPLRKYKPVEGTTVAAAMVAAAIGGTPGKHVYHWREIQALAGNMK